MTEATTSPAKEKLEEGQQMAQEKAREAKAEARSRLSREADERSTQAGEEIVSTAQAFRSVAENLRSEGKDQPAKLVEQAADKAESLGGWLRESDGDALLRDVEDFARRKPWAMGLAGLAVGFAAARFLKASSRERSRRSLPERTSHGNGYDRESIYGAGPPAPQTSQAEPMAPRQPEQAPPTAPLDPPSAG